MPSNTVSTTVHLVDASPYIFRGYFSIPSSFQNPAGQPVNAVYGFAQFLRKLREVEPITHLALAFDRSLDTESMADVANARRRLVFDELLRIQLLLVLRKRALEASSHGVSTSSMRASSQSACSRPR